MKTASLEKKEVPADCTEWEMLGEQMLAWRWHELFDLIANWSWFLDYITDTFLAVYLKEIQINSCASYETPLL